MKTSKEQKFREELFSEKLKVNIAYDTGKEQGIKQGRFQAFAEVACLLRDLCFKKEGTKKLKLWCYNGIEADKYDEIQEEIKRLENGN
jgi:hypothetical protein